eukprot:gene6530-6600_t
MSTSLPAPHGSMLVLKTHASWLLAFGVLLIVLGMFALGSVMSATLATVFYVGILMLMAGVGEIFIAFQMRAWSGFFFWMILGLASTLAGFLTFNNPSLAAGILTLFLGISLAIAGVVRIYLAFHMRHGAPWGLMGLSGALTILVGLMILSQWPTSSLYTLGLFLGIDLIFVGVSWFNVGWTVRKLEVE